MKLFWRIYFWGIVIITVLSLIADIASSETITARYVGYVGSLLGLVGLYGYISKRAIGWRIFWRGFVVFQVAALISLVAMSIWSQELQSVGDYMAEAFLSGLMILVYLPYLLGLYRYCFKSEEIWLGSNQQLQATQKPRA